MESLMSVAGVSGVTNRRRRHRPTGAQRGSGALGGSLAPGAAVLVLAAALLCAGCAATQSGTSQASAEAESAETVEGLNGWTGQITGEPWAGAKFTKLQIGMSRAEIEDLVGEPTDEGSYASGKAWIPYYYGSDKVRTELHYKGQGRLILSSSGGFSADAGHLTEIIYDQTERGYR